VGLALPAGELAETVSYLCRHGDRHAGYIGIRVADVDISPGIEIPYPAALVADGRTPGRIVDQGVMVTGVIPGEPAFRAGLQPGDLLFSIGGLAINSAGQLQQIVRNKQPGSRLSPLDHFQHGVWKWRPASFSAFGRPADRLHAGRSDVYFTGIDNLVRIRRRAFNGTALALLDLFELELEFFSTTSFDFHCFGFGFKSDSGCFDLVGTIDDRLFLGFEFSFFVDNS
jgi:hypothetical protein